MKSHFRALTHMRRLFHVLTREGGAEVRHIGGNICLKLQAFPRHGVEEPQPRGMKRLARECCNRGPTSLSQGLG